MTLFFASYVFVSCNADVNLKTKSKGYFKGLKKRKRQTTEWEKTFTSHSTHKVLIYRIYKKCKKLNSRRTNNPINKWANE
jgi:hypothetical protein